MTDPRELMQLHVEALFTHDAKGQLVRLNEPDGAPAPRFFLGWTAQGAVRRFRHDVGPDVRRALEAASRDQTLRGRDVAAPIDPAPYAAILAGTQPVARSWAGPAFCVPRDLPPAPDTTLVGDDTAHLLQPLLEDWIPDVRSCAPMVALVVDGRAVSLCCSVRRTGRAHEAGVETAPPVRGRGYAADVVAGWAHAVRALGCVPLYSTSWENAASRAVARRLRLLHFGSDLHFT